MSNLENKTIQHKDFESNKLTRPLQTVRFKLNKTGKKALRSELVELCKTKTKKGSPDMFKFL